MTAQTAGIVAQNVKADIINLGPAASDSPDPKTVEAIDKLWEIILAVKAVFSQISFFDQILLSSELDDYFAGRFRHAAV
jgi:hypothetical protein